MKLYPNQLWLECTKLSWHQQVSWIQYLDLGTNKRVISKQVFNTCTVKLRAVLKMAIHLKLCFFFHLHEWKYASVGTLFCCGIREMWFFFIPKLNFLSNGYVHKPQSKSHASRTLEEPQNEQLVSLHISYEFDYFCGLQDSKGSIWMH